MKREKKEKVKKIVAATLALLLAFGMILGALMPLITSMAS